MLNSNLILQCVNQGVALGEFIKGGCFDGRVLVSGYPEQIVFRSDDNPSTANILAHYMYKQKAPELHNKVLTVLQANEINTKIIGVLCATVIDEKFISASTTTNSKVITYQVQSLSGSLQQSEYGNNYSIDSTGLNEDSYLANDVRSLGSDKEIVFGDIDSCFDEYPVPRPSDETLVIDWLIKNNLVDDLASDRVSVEQVLADAINNFESNVAEIEADMFPNGHQEQTGVKSEQNLKRIKTVSDNFKELGDSFINASITVNGLKYIQSELSEDDYNQFMKSIDTLKNFSVKLKNKLEYLTSEDFLKETNHF